MTAMYISSSPRIRRAPDYFVGHIRIRFDTLRPMDSDFMMQPPHIMGFLCELKGCVFPEAGSNLPSVSSAAKYKFLCKYIYKIFVFCM